jgi:hypothetical protein
LERKPAGETEELLPVRPGEIRDRAQHALFPYELIGERRDRAHVDAGTDDGTRLRDRTERRRHKWSDRREDDGRIERLRRRLGGGTCPLDPQLASERLSLEVARTGEREHAPALVTRCLGHDVRCRAESVDAEPLGVACGTHCPVPDQSCTKQRGCVHIPVGAG